MQCERRSIELHATHYTAKKTSHVHRHKSNGQKNLHLFPRSTRTFAYIKGLMLLKFIGNHRPAYPKPPCAHAHPQRAHCIRFNNEKTTLHDNFADSHHNPQATRFFFSKPFHLPLTRTQQSYAPRDSRTIAGRMPVSQPEKSYRHCERTHDNNTFNIKNTTTMRQ